MMDEKNQQINQSRIAAAEMGEAAIQAISLGDIGMARTAARQAAQWARIVMQLETGEKQVEPEASVPVPQADEHSPDAVTVDPIV